jgi:hypothetical protein
MADGPKLTGLGKLFIVLFVAGCIYGAYFLFIQKPKSAPGNRGASSASDSVFDTFSGGNSVEIGIAYGTEKERWLKWAVEEFGKTKDGKRIKARTRCLMATSVSMYGRRLARYTKTRSSKNGKSSTARIPSSRKSR